MSYINTIIPVMSVNDMQYFRGIGNEVVVTSVIALLLLLLLCYFWLSSHDSQTTRRNSTSSPSWTQWLPAWLYQPELPVTEEIPDTGDRPHYNVDTCSICITSPRLALETNCGHLFCGPCILALYSHHSGLQAMGCPLCRQSVSIFYECFTDEERRVLTQEGDSVRKMVQSYNRRFSGQHNALWSHIRDLPTTLRHVWREVVRSDGDSAVMLFRLRMSLFLISTVLYLASPLDLVPEAAFGVIGLLDDVMVVVLLCIYLSIMYRRLVVSRGAAQIDNIFKMLTKDNLVDGSLV